MAVGQIKDAKELSQTYQPLLLAEFIMPSGPVLRVSSHPLNAAEGGYPYNGHDYLAAITNYDITATQALSEQGIDFTPQVTVTLADATKDIWANYERAVGMKGAVLKLTFIFWNVGQNDFSSDYIVKFVGVCGSPQVTTDSISVTATSLMNMSQTMLPPIRVQRKCPWIFPITAVQRQDAADDESSQFWLCGYSADATGASKCGNLNGGSAYTACDYTYTNCLDRLGNGQYITKDLTNRPTGRFGGFQWTQPQSAISRGYISGKWEEITNNSNEAKYGDLVPLHYGCAWTDPLILSSVGDANFTYMHVLLGYGEFNSVKNVVVNGTDIPHTFNDSEMSDVPAGVRNASDASKTGWWACLNRGDRNGAIDSSIHLNEQPDPYGNMCVLWVVVPRKLADSSSLARVQVLAEGARIRTWSATNPGGWTLDSATGMYWKKQYTDNLSWVMMDVLTWANWRYTGMNVQSFIDYADRCAVPVSYTDQFGGTSTHARYSCSLVIRQRRSASEVVRGLRTAGKALLYQDSAGLLKVRAKETLASQQPNAIAGSNYPGAGLAGPLVDGTTGTGFPAYCFDESNIAKNSDQKTPSITISQRQLQEAPNRVSFPFQDADNRYAADTLAITDAEDVARIGQEVVGSVPIDGINNVDQGRRAVGTWMAENYRGNPRADIYGNPAGDTGGTVQFEFDTSCKVIHLNVGDLCTLGYQQLGVANQLVRIVKVQPQSNFQRAKITAWHHNDNWYLDSYAQQDAPLWKPDVRNRLLRPSYGWNPYQTQPVAGDKMYGADEWGFGLAQLYETAADGTAIAKLRITGKLPVNVISTANMSPFVGLQGTTASTGGSIKGGATYYVAICARDSDGKLCYPSKFAAVAVPPGTDTNTLSVAVPYTDSSAGTHSVFGSYNPNRLCWQKDVTGALTSVTLTAMKESTWGLPDSEFDHMMLRVKRIRHGGNWGQIVEDCTATTLTIPCLTGAEFGVNQWAGHDISLLALKAGASVPLDLPIATFRVQSNTGTVLTLASGSPDPTAIPRGDGSSGLIPGDVLVMRFLPTVGSDSTGHYIEDPDIINVQNGLLEPFNIGDASNASPIVITTTDPHPYATGDLVYVQGVNGNDAANGKWTVTVLDSTTFRLDGSSGNGGYTGGGVVNQMQQGLELDAERGNMLFFIAGTGHGTKVKIKSNTRTRLYIEGQWPVTPDSSSRFVILEPTWQIESAQASVNNDSEATEVPVIIDGTNYKDQTLFVQAFTVDGGGDESGEHDAPFREIYLLGGKGAGGFTGAVHVTVPGPLAIGSDLSPRVFTNATTRAVAVRAKVKQAPVGADLTFRVRIGSTSWMTLTIADGETFVDASSADLANAPDLTEGTDIKLDITAVGSTSPGSDLSVIIFFQ